jgi:hypothetical protein
MSKEQPAFCSNCGKPGMYKVEHSGRMVLATTCSKECYYDLDWKNVLCIMNTEYYPEPEESKAARIRK